MPGVDFCGLPDRPFETEDDIISAVKLWASNPTTNGGAFGIRKSCATKACNNHGPRRLLVCDRQGAARRDTPCDARPNQISKMCDCAWGIWIEQVAEGWTTVEMPKKARAFITERNLNSIAIAHNHDLLRTTAETNTNSNLRTLSPDLKDAADILWQAGRPPSEIFAFLSKLCQQNGVAVTFTSRDIYNLYAETSTDKALDCSNLIQYLQERKCTDSSLTYDYCLTKDGVLSRVFFVITGGMELWDCLKEAVLLYDTKHGTNRYGVKLGCLTTIDHTGKTQVLAASLILHEDEESFTWVFKCFSESFQHPPVVVFTDSDPAMEKAIPLAWPEAVHLLCTFHLFKNFYENMRPLFVNRKNEWNVAASWWWKLCKTSDSAMKEKFSGEWKKLTEYILNGATANESVLEKKSLWLQSMGAKAARWAACYTWQNKTYGIHSTQRAEAIHSVIQSFCSKHSSIKELVLDIERMASNQHSKAETEALRRQLNAKFGPTAATLPIAAKLAEELSEYAACILRSQAGQITHYTKKRTAETDAHGSSVYLVSIDDGIYDSSNFGDKSTEDKSTQRAADHGILELGRPEHKTSVHECSCQFHSCFGLPCRHSLYIMFIEGYKEVSVPVLAHSVFLFSSIYFANSLLELIPVDPV